MDRRIPSSRTRSARERPVAIVTGAGRGIGRATAEALGAKGYALVLAELMPGLGRTAERALKKAGYDAIFVQTDVSEPDSATRCVQAAMRRFGRIACLVNNAGVLSVGPLVSLPVGEVNRILDVNLRGAILMARAVLPAMIRRGSGVIVSVSSLLGKSGAGDYVTYCASKFGVVGLTEALADEVAGKGIKVWAVCPNMVDTAMARKTGLSASVRHRALKPEAVAEAIVALAVGSKRAPSGSAIDIV